MRMFIFLFEISNFLLKVCMFSCDILIKNILFKQRRVLIFSTKENVQKFFQINFPKLTRFALHLNPKLCVSQSWKIIPLKNFILFFVALEDENKIGSTQISAKKLINPLFWFDLKKLLSLYIMTFLGIDEQALFLSRAFCFKFSGSDLKSKFEKDIQSSTSVSISCFDPWIIFYFWIFCWETLFRL